MPTILSRSLAVARLGLATVLVDVEIMTFAEARPESAIQSDHDETTPQCIPQRGLPVSPWLFLSLFVSFATCGSSGASGVLVSCDVWVSLVFLDLWLSAL